MQRRAFCCLICLLLALAPAVMAEGTFVMAGYDGEGSTHDWNTNGFCPHAGKNGPDLYL